MAAKPKQGKGGAMFNTTKCTVSKETQDLLNLMMSESKLTNFQRKKLNSSLRDGKSLPATCAPTSSQVKPKPKSPTKSPTPKVMNGRNLTNSGKRRKDTIDTMTECNREEYRPSPGKHITEKDKRALQYKMSYGVDIPDLPKRTTKLEEDFPPPTPQDEFDEILQAIEERREFLSEMESLGQGKQYRKIIETEISQKIRVLEVLDKKRTKELEEALKEG